MGTLLADIFVTIGGNQSPERADIVRQSIESLIDNTAREQFRLTACFDGPSRVITDAHEKQLPLFKGHLDYQLMSTGNEGLGPTINRAVAHICSINDWYGHPTHGDPSKVAPFIVGCQDDCLYEKGWLQTLVSKFQAYERTHKIGFATGHEAVEHAKTIRSTIDGRIFTQDWIRMTNVLGRREYWQSMCPIPRLDPETNRVRAKPNDGMGSSVDWWFLRNHPNSVCKTGKTCLVMPGLVKHIGHETSTWLDRPLPESESDRAGM